MTTSNPPHDELVTAADANRRFSKLLAGASRGRSYVVTSHGRPIARVVPFVDTPDTERRKAVEAHLESLRARPVRNLPRWTREELNDELLAERGLGR